MAVDYSKFLDVEVENIQQERHLPTGHFFADIITWKTAERDYKDDRGKIPTVELSFRTTSPGDDVDEAALPENGGIGVLLTKDYNLNDVSNGKVEGGGQAQLRRLAEETLGIPGKGLKLSDLLDALKGQAVRVYNDPRADKNDNMKYYNRVTKVLAPVDEAESAGRRRRG